MISWRGWLAEQTKRISYASTDVGGQLVFCVISFYLLKFYTDVYGLSAAAAGTILLVARLVDAVDAPVWGIIFDRTRSRWGKHRPWFLRLCFPFAASGVLMFTTPHFGPAAKIVYAALTYVTCSVLYTGINTPVTSILSALTPDPAERLVLNNYRMFGSKFGVLIVNLSALALVARLGGGDDRKGFERTMLLFACGSVLLFLFAFCNLKEKVKEPPRPLSIRLGFRALKDNPPWAIIFVSNLMFWVAFTARIVTAPYFFQYVLHRRALTSVAMSLDFISLASIFAIPWLVRRSSKRNVWIAGLVGAVVSQVVIHFAIGAGSVAGVMTGWALGFITSGIPLALPFSMLSETVDYGEWKSGVRAAGLLTAVGTAFCIKAGSGLGGALPSWIMDFYDYVPNVEQSARGLLGIRLGFVWLPAVFYALAILPLFYYHRYEREEPRIRQTLEERRALAATVSAAD